MKAFLVDPGLCAYAAAFRPMSSHSGVYKNWPQGCRSALSGQARRRRTYRSGGLEDVIVDTDEDDPEAGPVEVEREPVVDREVVLREEAGPGDARAENQGRPAMTFVRALGYDGN